MAVVFCCPTTTWTAFPSAIMFTLDSLHGCVYLKSSTRMKLLVFAAGLALFPLNSKWHPNELFTFYLLPDTFRRHKQDQWAANLAPETTVVKYVSSPSLSLSDPLSICLGRRFTCGKRSQRFFIYFLWRNNAEDSFQRPNRITSSCFPLYFLSCFWILMLFLLWLLLVEAVLASSLNIERSFLPFSRGSIRSRMKS